MVLENASGALKKSGDFCNQQNGNPALMCQDSPNDGIEDWEYKQDEADYLRTSRS